MKSKLAVKASFFGLFLIFVLLISTIPAYPAFASEAENKPERLHFAKSLDSSVYGERLVYEVFKRLDIDVSFSLEDMDVCLQGTNAGIYDGICSQAYGIEASFDQLVAIPIETSTVTFYALTLQEDPFTCNSWSDLSGKKIGTLSGKTVIKNSLPSDILKHLESTSMSLLYDSLRSRECDVAIITESSYRSVDQIVVPSEIKVAGQTETRSATFFLNKKYSGLVNQITETLEGMEADGSWDRIKAMKPVEDRNEKLVLYLSSYSSEMQWEQHLVQGISNVLNQEREIEFYSMSLNSFRNTNVGLRETEVLKDLSMNFIHTPPDAVIVSDNEAMSFLLSNYNSILPNDIPVIACGLNNTSLVSSSKSDRFQNISGIVESVGAAETVNEMLKLFPSTKEIFVINDYSLTGRRWQNEIESQLEPFVDRVRISYNENTSFDDLITHVSSLGDQTLVLCGSYCLDNRNHFYPQASIQTSLYTAAAVPIFGLLDDSLTNGQLGGMYTNGVLHGEIAANYLVDMLKTNSFGKITYVDPEKDNEWVFNWDVMQQYGIEKDQLPHGATLLNAPLSLRETDPVLYYTVIVGGVAALLGIISLVIFSVLLNRRNKKLRANVELLEYQKAALGRANNDIQELTEKTMTDSLTGLYTREASRQLADEHMRFTQSTNISAFMIIDIDNFKLINDTLGHPYGDKILCETAEILRKMFRKTDVITRLGGDEFSVFLKDIPNREFATSKADDLLKQLQFLGKNDSYVSASVGISFFPENGNSFDVLYQKSDKALYHAKSGGKNQYAINTESSDNFGK